MKIKEYMYMYTYICINRLTIHGKNNHAIFILIWNSIDNEKTKNKICFSLDLLHINLKQ